MATGPYSLAEVIAVARLHPFYAPKVEYPPDPQTIEDALRSIPAEAQSPELGSLPLLMKKDLYHVIQRLTNDTNPRNDYRRSAYISTTGGGSGGLPLMFATDTKENRAHRAVFGEFVRTCGLIEPRDWVLTTHTSGCLYRSLDLISEILENAGASVLCAGSRMEAEEIVSALAHYHATVLTGDSSQIVNIVHFISTLPAAQRKSIQLQKVIYTSDPLTETQRSHITAVLGPVQICSILGSAEAGPFAVSNPSLTGEHTPPGTRDFIFDTRSLVIEILPRSALDCASSCHNSSSSSSSSPVPDGEQGIIVQTSLQRLRNPLVRYVTGDIGSVHAMPDSAREKIPDAELQHFRVLRLAGRDRRFSFKWFGEYFEFEGIESLMQTEGSGVLQWQVVRGCLASSPQPTLEVRILRAADGEHVLPRDVFVDMVETFFYVYPENRYLFRITFVDGLDGFEKSSTGNKVMKFVDRFV